MSRWYIMSMYILALFGWWVIDLLTYMSSDDSMLSNIVGVCCANHCNNNVLSIIVVGLNLVWVATRVFRISCKILHFKFYHELCTNLKRNSMVYKVANPLRVNDGNELPHFSCKISYALLLRFQRAIKATRMFLRLWTSPSLHLSGFIMQGIIVAMSHNVGS